LLWYYVGRITGRGAVLDRLLRATVGIALCGAAYGLYQTWFGFSTGEKEWLRLSGYAALSVGGTIRAFSFLTSAAEYASFVGMGIAVLYAAWLRGGRAAALLPVPLLAVALFLESSRGPVVLTVVTCVVLWAVQGRTACTWLPRGLLALALAVAGLFWSLNQARQITFSEHTQSLAAHQTEGLLNPLDEKHSTATTHSAMFLNGFVESWKNPLGRGLGATTLAASKFGKGGDSTEVDLSNVFVSAGVFGGLLYTAIIGAVLVTAFRHWRASRSFASLAVLGVLFFTLGHWLNGQQYASSMLIWFCIGALDRAQRETLR
jgi:hypothetical protein